ncbi:hypothetical protein ACX800_09200 [Paenarthrobacter nitroguajacolicus]|uniref:hypothetical protein n=1 Tax=Paenarthrobacter nitroguajacolicus TaxID=211146 RepID=UPI000A45D0D8
MTTKLPVIAEKKTPVRTMRMPPLTALLQAAARAPWASANCRKREGAPDGLIRASSGESQ